jgi:hypothetical protein
MRTFPVAHFGIAVLVVAAAVQLISGSASGNPGIIAEGVSDYSFYRSVHPNSITPNIYGREDANGFYTKMTQSGYFWGTHYYPDGSVWDTDFYDPDFSSNPADNDTSNFDEYGAAFAYVSAHGSCDDTGGIQTCNTGADCFSGWACLGSPPTTHQARCTPNKPRTLYTSSPSSSHDNVVSYGNGSVKWGEDSNSGGWAGAGTNGGASVFFVRNSCGVRIPFHISQTAPMFAGAMIIQFAAPHSNLVGVPNSDTLQSTDDGLKLATQAMGNLNGTIVYWSAVAMDSKNVGSGCPNSDGDMTYGGGKGYSGCGADVSIAMDSTGAAAQDKIYNLTWNQATDATRKPHGTGAAYYWAHCNYDCVKYPFTK